MFSITINILSNFSFSKTFISKPNSIDRDKFHREIYSQNKLNCFWINNVVLRVELVSPQPSSYTLFMHWIYFWCYNTAQIHIPLFECGRGDENLNRFWCDSYWIYTIYWLSKGRRSNFLLSYFNFMSLYRVEVDAYCIISIIPCISDCGNIYT